MSSYNNGFTREDIEVLPGCAFFEPEGEAGFCLGFTREGSVMTVEQGLQAVNADEVGETPLDHFMTGVKARIELVLLETDLAQIVKVIPTATLTAGRLTFGGVPGGKAAVGRVYHRPFAYPDGSRDILLHRATNISDQSFTHKHTDPDSVTCAFEGTADLTKSDGDLLGGVGQA